MSNQSGICLYHRTEVEVEVRRGPRMGYQLRLMMQSSLALTLTRTCRFLCLAS